MVKEVKELLEYESIPYDIRIWDLEKAIKYENPPMSIRQKIELDLEQGHPLTWFRYHEYEDITRFLDFLQHNYPNIVQLIHIGRSFEGRPLVVVKVILIYHILKLHSLFQLSFTHVYRFHLMAMIQV